MRLTGGPLVRGLRLAGRHLGRPPSPRLPASGRGHAVVLRRPASLKPTGRPSPPRPRPNGRGLLPSTCSRQWPDGRNGGGYFPSFGTKVKSETWAAAVASGHGRPGGVQGLCHARVDSELWLEVQESSRPSLHDEGCRAASGTPPVTDSREAAGLSEQQEGQQPPVPAACSQAALRTGCGHRGGGGGPRQLPIKPLLKPEKRTVPIEQPFSELGLKDIQEQVGGCRVRQHVNPLKASLMTPLEVPDWSEVFANPRLPLSVDIGCGSGRLLMVLAKRSNGLENYLGLEIRERLVERCLLWTQELCLSNIHFFVANASISFDSILATYPGKLKNVFILCPDPHFKKRHQKRRVLQEDLVQAIVKRLEPGGQVFIQSDVEGVARDMMDQLEQHAGPSLAPAPQHCDGTAACADGWLLDNPLNIPTEREVYVLSMKERMYRRLYVRTPAS
eukprot:SM000042S15321  [mRNA]  locus=s42:289108:291954:+ [translate_table: standard]